MKTRPFTLIAAPTAMQPGGYIAKAYAGRDTPLTPRAEIGIEGDTVLLRWRCEQPMIDASESPMHFIDGCALFAPEHADSPWITMGAPGMAVSGVLWRADRADPYAIRAEGLGTMQRSPALAGWKTEASYAHGIWTVTFTLPHWAPFAAQKKLAAAIWQGAQSERAGLKSVSADWLTP